MKKHPFPAAILIILLVSCATPKKAPPAPETPSAPAKKGYYGKAEIIGMFREETGFSFIKDAQSVEFFQNEISSDASIIKYTLFLSEDDIYSVLAQKPPFSSEWTSSDVYRDYQNEWTNLQKMRLRPYSRIYPNDPSAAAKPLTEKGFISLKGSLDSKPGTLKMMCVNVDYDTIVLYVIKNG